MNLEEVESVLRQWGRWDRDYPAIARLTGAYSSPAGRIVQSEVQATGDVFQDSRGSEWVDIDLMLKVDKVYRNLPEPYRRLVFVMYRENQSDKSAQKVLGITPRLFDAVLLKVKNVFRQKL